MRAGARSLLERRTAQVDEVTLAAAAQSAARHGWRATNTIARLNPHPAADHTTFPFSPTAMQLYVVSALFFITERCSGET